MRRLSLLLGLVLVLSCAWVAPALAGSDDDQDIADSAILTEDDAASFDLTEARPSDGSPPSGSVCKAIRTAEKAADGAPGVAVSKFEDDLGTVVEDQVSVFPSVKAARKVLAAYTNRKALSCLEKTLEESLQEDLPAGSSYEFDGEPQPIGIGDGGIVVPILVTVTLDDGTVTDQVVEFGVFSVGRAFVSMNTLNRDEAFAGSEQFATIIADNLDSNL